MIAIHDTHNIDYDKYARISGYIPEYCVSWRSYGTCFSHQPGTTPHYVIILYALDLRFPDLSVYDRRK